MARAHEHNDTIYRRTRKVEAALITSGFAEGRDMSKLRQPLGMTPIKYHREQRVGFWGLYIVQKGEELQCLLKRGTPGMARLFGKWPGNSARCGGSSSHPWAGSVICLKQIRCSTLTVWPLFLLFVLIFPFSFLQYFGICDFFFEFFN